MFGLGFFLGVHYYIFISHVYHSGGQDFRVYDGIRVEL